MRKRALYGILPVIVVLILALSACKKTVGTPEDNAAAKEDTEEEAEMNYVVGF